MKHFFTLLLFLSFCLIVQAQQPSHYSLYMMNKLHWNPAYAGMDHSLSLTGIFRKQWVGLEGSPTTQNLNVHMPLYFLSGGVGINFENDILGAEKYTRISLAYNYQMDLGNGILSLGVGAGIVQRELDGSKLRTPEGNYSEPGVINHEDGVLPLGKESGMTTTFNAGVYYQSELFDASLSVKNITEPSADLGTLSLQLVRNYFFMTGFNFDISRSLSLHPSVFVRSDVNQTQIDFTTLLRYNDNIFGGASFRGYNEDSIDAVTIIVGFKLSENLSLAYAYDLTLSDLNTVSNGSHEIMVNYNLNKRIGVGRPPKIIYNPRSL